MGLRIEELRKFWGEKDLRKAQTSRIVVYPGANEDVEYQRMWSDGTQYPIVKEWISPIHQFENMTFLDFGCGVGRISRQLLRMGYNVIGADVSPILIEHAKAYCADFDRSVRFYVTNGYDCSDINTESIDGLISVVTFQHMLTEGMVFSNLTDFHRVMKKGGEFHIQFAKFGASKDSETGGFIGVKIEPEKIINRLTKIGFASQIKSYQPLYPNWFGIIGKKL